MSKSIQIIFFGVLCLLLTKPELSFGQSLEDDPQMILAENLFNNQDYAAALENYQNLEGRIFNEPYLKYKIGLCFFHSPNQKGRAIDYLKYALKYRNQKVPPEVYYYLGKLYHYTYNFDSAIEMFESYKKDERSFNLVFLDTDRLIEMCYNGKEILKMDEIDVEVEVAAPPTNTSFNDYAPLVRPNGKLLMFSSDRPTESVDLVLNSQKYVFIPDELRSNNEDIFMAYPRGLGWDFPYPQDLKGKKVIPLSFRANGSELLMFIGETLSEGDLYISKFRGSRWTPPKKLDSNINSKYDERGACFGDNGRVIYFASNRPNGYGGFDIYVSKQEGKDWGTPINLGPTINSKYDEVNPFMLPGETKFYFSSDGHNSMGGLDIFLSNRIESFTKWSKPENLGYPINSTYDDDYFVQRTDGKFSFLSSNRNQIESVGEQDIISVFKPEKNNPMAMVKGKLTVEKDNELIEVKLKVIDKHTREEQIQVYNPDLEREGEYFMILTPRKTYEIHIITSDDYVHVIDITLPEEAYSYELNKHIVIESFNLFGQKIGEKPNVKSSDYTLTRVDEVEDKRDLKYDVLLMLMERIVDAQDLQKASSLDMLDNKTPFPSKSGPDPYYTPVIDYVRKALKSGNPQALRDLDKPILKKDIVFSGTMENNRKLVISHEVLFEPKASLLTDKVMEELNKLVMLLKDNHELKLEIAYPNGSDKLTLERVDAIYDFFSERQVMDHQVIKRIDNTGNISNIMIYLYEESQL